MSLLFACCFAPGKDRGAHYKEDKPGGSDNRPSSEFRPSLDQDHQLVVAETSSSAPPIRWATNSRAQLLKNGCKLRSPQQLFVDVTGLRRLGGGSQSTVFSGLWHMCNVAVKLVYADSWSPKSPSFLEAVVASSIFHPHVVQVFDIRCAHITPAFLEDCRQKFQTASAGLGEMSDGLPKPTDSFNTLQAVVGQGPYVDPTTVLTGIYPGQYATLVVMELCNRGSLSQALQKGVFKPGHAKWPERTRLRAILRTAREVAQGVMHLHNQGIIHGDITAKNVLLQSSRLDKRGFIAKITDYGFSRLVLDCSAIKTSLAGTVTFMSPELLRGSLGKASDVYSWGVLLWTMYMSRLPFEELKPVQVVQGILSREIHLEWPSGCNLPDLARLGQACLSFEAASRPGFEEVIKELGRIELEFKTACMQGQQVRPPPGGAAAAGAAGADPTSGQGSGGGRDSMALSASEEPSTALPAAPAE